jgi:tRNA pseudouridine38-40 synthase
MNRVLDSDLVAISSEQVSDAFHSRFFAGSRCYRYRIAIGARDPMRARYVHTHWEKLDLASMRKAAQALVGRHDYRAYTEELDPRIDNTVRTLHRVEVKAVRDEIWLDVEGTAFLRGMMRRMAGALFEVGRGMRPVEEVAALLTDRRSQMHWAVVLPARGLTLMKVKYGRHPVDNRTKTEQLENELNE